MGAVCCVAAKDRTIVHAPSGETLQRHVGYFPSRSFGWDNRVAGEESRASWLHDGGVRNNHVKVISGTTVQTMFASEQGSSRDCLSLHQQKSPVSNRNARILKLSDSDEAISRNMDEVKESTESPSISRPSLLKYSPSAPSASTSTLTSQSRLHRPRSTPSRGHHYSREPQFLHQVSGKLQPFSISKEASSHPPPGWGNKSIRGSNSGSSDRWSIPVFSELMPTRRSFDSENSGFIIDEIDQSSWRSSDSPINLQNCGACAKLLSKRSLWSWSCQKIISGNELAVVSILNCGHVYHAECLEHMTPEMNKYDPACLICTYGEKQALKKCEKALKAELDRKARKRCRNHGIGSDLKRNKISLNRHEHGGADGMSIIKKSSSPFLKRHLSFISKSGKPMQDNQCTPRKGFLWSRSTKE